MKKVIVWFKSSSKAKDFAIRVRKVPGVTYATDYCRTPGNFHVMVCGDWDEETEERIKSKRI